MMQLLLRASRRFYLRHPWQLALAIAGISLGVAVYVGVELANDSARRAFELSSDAVLGRTTHRLLPVGARLPESVFTDLVTARGVTRAAPVIEAELRLPAAPDRRYTLLGVDPIKEPDVRGFVGFAPESSADIGRLMLEPGSVLLPESLVAQLAPERGARLEAVVDGRRASVTYLGRVRGAGGASDADPPAVADIGTVQALTGKIGYLDRIDLRLDDESARILAANPPEGTTLVSAEGGGGGFSELTRAFRTNLSALGLLALVVGMFLIYSTMSFAIVQRRGVLGALLAVGLDRRQLLAGVLLEAMVIGSIATALGLAMGHLLALGLVDLVLRTIGDLYFSAEVSAAAPSPWIYAKGAALGIGATLVAALGPSADAASASPTATMRRSALERRTRERSRLAAWLAIPTLAIAAALLALDSRDLYLAFGGLFFVLVAGAMLTPAATSLIMKALEPAAERGFGLPGLLAVRGVTASLSRTGVATAALAVAVATVIGVGLMISSFRASLVEWLDTTLTADLYISLGDASDASLDDALLERIESVPGVLGLSLTQFARLPTEEGGVGLRAVMPGPEGWGLDLVAGEAASLDRLLAEPVVAVAEPFAFQRRLSVGDTVELPTPEGPRRFPVVAVFRDYNAGGNSVLMSLTQFNGIWGNGRLNGIGVHIEEGVEVGRVREAVAQRLPASLEGRIRSTEGLVALSLEVFDRTFKITEVLRILAALIAFLGVLSALLSIQLEKTRELAILRAVGLAPSQLGTLMLTQTTLLGAAAGLAAIPLGAALAGLLVHVINRRSFGWSMDLIISPGPLLAGLSLAIGAAVLAGIYPAYRMRHAALAGGLREE